MGVVKNTELKIPRVSSIMSRPLESLSLCSPHKAKLARAGYETVDDMKYVRVAELSRGRYVIPRTVPKYTRVKFCNSSVSVVIDVQMEQIYFLFFSCLDSPFLDQNMEN